MLALHEEGFDAGMFRAIVEIAHSRYVGRIRDHYISDPAEVSARAVRYASHLQERRPSDPGMRPMLTARDVATAGYAGLGVYCMDRYGFDYCYLARVTWPGVASAVREVSRDLRDDVGPARQARQRRIYDAAEISQLVAFAELVETAKGLKKRLDADDADGVAADRSWLYARAWTGMHNHHELAAWVDHAAAMINGMQRLFFPGATAMAPTRAKMESLLVRLGERAKVRQVRRAARAKLLAAEADAAAAEPQGGGAS